MASNKRTYKLFTERERKKIHEAIERVADQSFREATTSDIMLATSGMYFNYTKPLAKFKLKNHYDYLLEALDKGIDPIIHEDSMTAWINQAVDSSYSLNIGNITKMKFGEQHKILFFDRNIGDYTYDFPHGKKFDPRKMGLEKGTYIHGSDLSGLLSHDNAGVIISKFDWEVNKAAMGSTKWFWGPLDTCTKGKTNTKLIDIKKLNSKIKVGWRGPSIKLSDTDFLPRHVKHYDTWFDDGGEFRYTDYLHKTKNICC
jgi:hypothetical protein